MQSFPSERWEAVLGSDGTGAVRPVFTGSRRAPDIALKKRSCPSPTEPLRSVSDVAKDSASRQSGFQQSAVDSHGRFETSRVSSVDQFVTGNYAPKSLDSAEIWCQSALSVDPGSFQ